MSFNDHIPGTRDLPVSTLGLRKDGAQASLAKLELTLSGVFDMCAAFRVWKSCHLYDRHYHQYIFDFSEVTEIREVGAAWLLMLARRARREGGFLRLKNCPVTLVQHAFTDKERKELEIVIQS
jgi:ABC-type transporter Mla MlaB component